MAARAYATGDYTVQAIADACKVHYSTVNRAVSPEAGAGDPLPAADGDLRADCNHLNCPAEAVAAA